MAGHSNRLALRRSGLSRRAVAAALTMVLLIAGTAVSCLTGSIAAGATAPGSEPQRTAAAHHELTGATSASEHQSGDGPAVVDQRTDVLHGGLHESLPAGGQGCSHSLYDSGNGTPVRAAAPDPHILYASSNGLPGHSYEPVRVAGIQHASPMTPSLVQLSISRT